MKAHLLSKASVPIPGFHAGWQPDPPDVIAANPRFGTIMHAVVHGPDGAPIYDQPVWAEPLGAVIVPLQPDGSVVFVENHRPVVAAGPWEYPPRTLDGCGCVSLELPRGFANPGEEPLATAVREAEEELGMEVGVVERLGLANPNTTYCIGGHEIYLARLTGRPSTRHPPDLAEGIVRTVTLDVPGLLHAIRSGRIFCGITKSALMTFFASQPAARRGLDEGLALDAPTGERGNQIPA